MARIVAILAATTVLGCSRSEPEKAQPPAPAAASATAASQPVSAAPEPAPSVAIRDKPTLAEALAYAKPHFVEEFDRHTRGGKLLAAWAVRHLRWADVAVTKNETSPGLVKKDADLERGKRLCVSGPIVQIKSVETEGVKVFRGIIMAGPEAVYFFAAGSTGEIVARSHARYCGVATARFSFNNTNGGVTHGIETVGMFDLPENRKADAQDAGPPTQTSRAEKPLPPLDTHVKNPDPILAPNPK